MSSETSAKLGSCSSSSGSMSFPNTRMQTSNSIEMGSKIFKFQPVRSEVLLKQLLEDNEDESPVPSPKHKTSHIMTHRGRNESFSSDDDSTSNILDKTMIEDDSIFSNKDLVPGISWLDGPPDNKPMKIIAKSAISTPLSNKFDKLSIRGQSSVKKESRPLSLERNNEPILKRTPVVNNNIFKTPSCRNSRFLSDSSTAQKLQSSEKSAIPPYNNQILSARKKRLEMLTPKVQKKLETPVQSSILQYAINRNLSTPKSNLQVIKEKESEAVLREKDMNINEIKPNKVLSNVEAKPNNDVKQLNVQATIPVKSLQESTFQQLKVRGKEYIIINKIGEGGSGQVYRCLEQETLQDRAIKVVNLNVDPATVTSYINEVKMLKDLQGNGRVVKMYDYEQNNQNLFVVMEKGDVDFSIFLRNITNESQIQTHIIVCYWIEMLKCVREIHNKGIIHSDLKPSNFLIVSGRLKLIDFGIASRLTADMTSVIKNVTVGTFNYISPEALLDSRDCPTDEKPHLRISYKSDVWSLGCILYQMVYKRTPFQSVGNMWAKFAMITDRNHKINYQQMPGVPLYLIEMIKKCLVYDMRSRPTVEDLLNMYYNGNYC